jgi:uncharacterized protein (DUF1501 family)
MTGYEKTGTNQVRPAIGSLVSKEYFAADPETGLPVYVKHGNIEFDKAIYLGSQYDPFDVNSDAKKNFLPSVEAQRLNERIHVLSELDSFQRESRHIKEMNEIKKMAYKVIFGKAREAFDLDKEDQRTRSSYGPGIGEQLLLARRLTQYGARFVSVPYNGWDNHTDLFPSLQNRVPPLDAAVATLIDDLKRLDRLQNTLIVITSEFGRTPKLNAAQSRDHYGRLNNLVFAGGRATHGRVVGRTDSKSTEVTESPFGPQDLLATILWHFGINNSYIKDFSGRPMKMNEKGQNILSV